MTWIKLDDTFFTHPKSVGLSTTAVTVFIRCICYSSQHLTDGAVPMAAIESWGITRWRHAIDTLATRSLVTVSEECLHVHDYLDYQRSAADAKKLRVKRAAAGAKGGTAKAAKAKQTSSKVLEPGLAEKIREEPSSSPPTTEAENLDCAAAYGGEEEVLRQTFALMARFDLQRARDEGVAIRTADGFIATAAQRRRDEGEDRARYYLEQHPTGVYYPLHVELAERLDPTCGPDDGGRQRAKARADATRRAREAEAAARPPRSNAGASAARAALTLATDQGAA